MLVSKDQNRRAVCYFYTNGRYWTASYFGRSLHRIVQSVRSATAMRR